MKKYLITAFLIVCAFFAGCKKQEMTRPTGTDFESLMGKDLPRWKFVQTQDDFSNLAFYKNLYDTNIPLLEESNEEYKIPKILHWIWIGPKSFPRESVEYVRSWLGKHPDWTCYFWTDRERVLPHPALKVRMIQDLKWENERLKEFYLNSPNFGEQSDILRLEILYQEGGIYVDHDVKCLKSFDPLNRAFDLYCGMEMPYKTGLASSVHPTNNTVAARKGHPILKRCMEWLDENWDSIEKAYPGNDRDSVIYRISHRTFIVLSNILKERANQNGMRDIALPTLYFNSPKEDWGIFAQHKYAGLWFEGESKFEKSVRERLMYLSKKANRSLLYIAISTLINILGFAGLSVLILKKRRA